jgi:hypothetical protein
MDKDQIKNGLAMTIADLNYVIGFAQVIRDRLLDINAAVDEIPDGRVPSVADILELKLPEQKRGWTVIDPLQGRSFCWQKIPARARKVLKHYKIKGPAGLREFTVRQIKKVDNAGPATIESIRALAKSYGIELKDR